MCNCETRIKKRLLNHETRRPPRNPNANKKKKKSDGSQTDDDDDGPGWLGYLGGSVAVMAILGFIYNNIESICNMMGVNDCRAPPGWPCILECKLKWTRDEIMRTQSSSEPPPPVDSSASCL